MTRYGMSVPAGDQMAVQPEYFRELEEVGYTDIWSSEVNGMDAFTPLTVAALSTKKVRLGTAIVPVFTRGPACLAQSVAALAQVAPGRVVVGLGSSSNIIVSEWNGLAYEKPLARTRDTVRFLKAALSGRKVSETYDTFRVQNVRLTAPPDSVPPIFVAALRKRMLQMAATEGDGVILNWLSASDIATVRRHLDSFGRRVEVVTRIFVCPSTDREAVRRRGREYVAAYLNVPVYRKFHEWLGRADDLSEMWSRWSVGDRKGAAAAVPDHVVDELIVHGSPAECRDHIQRYVDLGVDTPVLSLMQWDLDVRQAGIAMSCR